MEWISSACKTMNKPAAGSVLNPCGLGGDDGDGSLLLSSAVETAAALCVVEAQKRVGRHRRIDGIGSIKGDFRIPGDDFHQPINTSRNDPSHSF
jgi:hypothetical protein